MKKNIFIFVFSIIIFLIISTDIFAQTKIPLNNETTEMFEKHIFDASNKIKMPFRLLKPLNYDSTKTYPLVLFYHGAGERGTDNEISIKNISPFALNQQNRIKYPCFVLVPQCDKAQKWVNVTWNADSHAFTDTLTPYMRASVDLLDEIIKKYPINQKKIYVTGLSMGGYAVWDVITRFPEKFAAAVPICGGADELQAEKFKNMPIWVFHGAKDTTVKPLRSKNIIAKLKKLGAKPLYTEYPQVGHNSWKQAYTTPQLAKWLFKQSKK